MVKNQRMTCLVISDCCLDKFQGLIQMKDAATAQSAKLVNNLDSKRQS